MGFVQTHFDSIDDGIFRADVFHPGESPAAHPPYPVVVASSGYATDSSSMDSYSMHLASHGYAVLAFTVANPFALDLTNWATGFRVGLTTLVELGEDPESALHGLVDPDRVGFLGISMGGAGALEAAGTDGRDDATVALAPGINDLGGFLFADVMDAVRAIGHPDPDPGRRPGLPREPPRRDAARLHEPHRPGRSPATTRR